MTGLLAKDCRLMKSMKQSFFMILLIDIMIVWAQKKTDLVLGYTCIVISNYAIASITYDEQDNGFAFLFTLPISRAQYVMEKYLFSFLACAGSLTLLGVPAVLFNMRMSESFVFGEWIVSVGVYLFISLLMSSLMIPVNLKYGAARARTAMFAVVIAVVAILMLAGSLIDTASLEQAFNTLETLGPWLTAAIFLLSGFLLMGISMAASILIMEKKEF